MSFYDFKIKDIDGREVDFDSYKGKVVIVVNTASKCGFTPQFKELEELYKKYKDKGLEILGFPCNQFLNQDPAELGEIKNFCLINYGVSFRMFEKIKVNGKDTHPLYKFLKEKKGGLLSKEIKWNFTKFIIDKQGQVIERVSPNTNPLEMEDTIKKLLEE
ncbi:MAG: glutathione peroxidase [Clostridium sp.]